jgi:hypothetical protein
MKATGADFYYLIEMVLLCAIPFALIAAGVILRRRFPKPLPAEGQPSEPESGGRKAARVLGTMLMWAGIFAVLFCVIVALNFKGII